MKHHFDWICLFVFFSDGDYFNFNKIDKKYFKQMFYSTDFPQFLIRCYHKDGQYLTAILTARGIRIDTLTGINCLQNQFYDYHFVIKNDKRLVISQEDLKFCTRPSEREKCWLYECNEEMNNEKIMIFFFFAPKEPLGSLKDANGETQTIAGRGWRVVEVSRTNTYRLSQSYSKIQ